mgnify:CR=1 FL=1
MEIQTKRLIVRQLKPSDIDAVFEYMSDKVTSHYIAQGCLSFSETRNFIQSNFSRDAKCFALEKQGSNKVIGHVEFYPCYGEHTYEIGWIINKAFHRQGFAYEAAFALIKHAFSDLNIHRIIATCQPENKASYGLMEKLGMQREGHFVKCIPRGNSCWWDEYAYAILQENFNDVG